MVSRLALFVGVAALVVGVALSVAGPVGLIVAGAVLLVLGGVAQAVRSDGGPSTEASPGGGEGATSGSPGDDA